MLFAGNQFDLVLFNGAQSSLQRIHQPLALGGWNAPRTAIGQIAIGVHRCEVATGREIPRIDF